MKFEHPPEEAYGRVTDPRKFMVVVEAAEGMVARLERDFEVHRVAAGTSEFVGDRSDVTRVVSLEPSTGASVQFGFTDFPGVIVRFGRWCVEAFPACGCDACDPDPTAVVGQLEARIAAVTGGRYSEELTRAALECRFDFGWGSESSERRLGRNERGEYGEPGSFAYPAWTPR